MPRPTRSWVRKTYTVSPEVEKAIRMNAADLGVDEGTMVDILVWDALVKPDEDRYKAGGFSQQDLERIYAEEVIAILTDPLTADSLNLELASLIQFENKAGDPIPDSANLRKVKDLVRRWCRTRQIEKNHQAAVNELLGGKWIPSILKHEIVDQDWFLPQEDEVSPNSYFAVNGRIMSVDQGDPE